MTADQSEITIVGGGLAGALLAILLAQRGWSAVGVDSSPAMQRQAAATLRRSGPFVPRLQGRAQQLPFADKV